ncbi:Uncharacterised protein [Segatella copri]|nr:Uncharacterised protein [Segatella copri]
MKQFLNASSTFYTVAAVYDCSFQISYTYIRISLGSYNAIFRSWFKMGCTVHKVYSFKSKIFETAFAANIGIVERLVSNSM